MRGVPNAHGVYDGAQAERLTLPRVRKGWQGCPIAEIRLLHIADGWLEAVSYDTSGDDCRGGGYGLSAKWGVHPSRAGALDHAMTALRREVASGTSADCHAIERWLDGLIPDQIDMFADLAQGPSQWELYT